jgi:hypothetical protein
VKTLVFALAVWFSASSPVLGAAKHTVNEAKEYARTTLGSEQFRCIDNIFQRESHWNPLAHNRTSGAHGIPQAVPGSKMRSAGKDWYSNPVTQTKWGIRYVNRRYGSACNAWAFWQRNGWY